MVPLTVELIVSTPACSRRSFGSVSIDSGMSPTMNSLGLLSPNNPPARTSWSPVGTDGSIATWNSLEPSTLSLVGTARIPGWLNHMVFVSSRSAPLTIFVLNVVPR